VALLVLTTLYPVLTLAAAVQFVAGAEVEPAAAVYVHSLLVTLVCAVVALYLGYWEVGGPHVVVKRKPEVMSPAGIGPNCARRSKPARTLCTSDSSISRRGESWVFARELPDVMRTLHSAECGIRHVQHAGITTSWRSGAEPGGIAEAGRTRSSVLNVTYPALRAGAACALRSAVRRAKTHFRRA